MYRECKYLVSRKQKQNKFLLEKTTKIALKFCMTIQILSFRIKKQHLSEDKC